MLLKQKRNNYENTNFRGEKINDTVFSFLWYENIDNKKYSIHVRQSYTVDYSFVDVEYYLRDVNMCSSKYIKNQGYRLSTYLLNENVHGYLIHQNKRYYVFSKRRGEAFRDINKCLRELNKRLKS